MSRFKRMLRAVRLELRRARAAAMRCPGCGFRNVVVVDDRGFAQCTNCKHKPASDLLD